MGAVGNLAGILGEENQEKIKNEITDFIIQECKDEIQDRDFCLILHNADRLMEDLYEEIYCELKNTLKEMYIKRINEQFDDFIEKLGI